MNRTLRSAGLAALTPLALLLIGGCGSDPDPSNTDGGSNAEAPADPVNGSSEGTSTETTTPTTTADPKTPEAPTESSVEPNRFDPGGEIADADLGKYHVSMQCAIDGVDVGTMTFEMWTEAAPITTRNFMRLCDSGFYDGIKFHRVLRDFMVQGGDPTGAGSGESPYGRIKGEMTDDPERAHGYGVLSMARFGTDLESASSQFFLCCDESPSVWGLDGKYSSFGRMTTGVATLETIADVPVVRRGREVSAPTKEIIITKATVLEGAAPTGEVIERPSPPVDLGGEPERIVIQHVLISFQGCGLPEVTRTKEEAEALANQILAQAQAGADMDTLARENSDDPIHAEDETPGYYGLLNRGIRDRANEKKAFHLQAELQEQFTTDLEALRARINSGEIEQAAYQGEAEALQVRAQMLMMEGRYLGRDEMVPAFGDVGFSLEVGEVGLAAYDATASRFGYHVIKRIE